MNDLEEGLRNSLRQRAEDVEPTPALWQEVDRRIARRRRLQVTSWSLAGVAAALAAVIVVPGVLGGNGPGTLEIEPGGARGAGVVPSTAVVADGGEVWLLDLPTGARTPLDVGEGQTIEQVAVRPGSTMDDYRLVIVGSTPTGGSQLTFVDGPGAGGVSGVLEEHALEPDVVPTITWSPQGELIAYTVPADGGARVVIEQAPDGEGFLDPAAASDVGTIGADDVLLDWVGPVAAAGDVSELWVRRADGTMGILRVEATGQSDAFVSPSGGELAVPDGWGGVTEVAAAIGAFRRGEVVGLPTYLLAPGRQTGISLFWAGGDGDTDTTSSAASPVEVPLGPVVGDVDLEGLWLDASQDAALIGDGQRMWLVAHDGAGDFAPAVELAEGTVGALFDAPGSGAAEDGDAAGFTVPVVTVSDRQLTLVEPAGSTTLVTLGEEGSGRFISARVRPGSTVADLTVVALTEAEGLYDLRHLRYVDGELVTWEAFEPPYAPGSGGSSGDGASIRGPVWSPDGEHLAWFEWGTGPAALRTLGWRDGPGTGDPATDNAMFTLDGFGAMPLVPVEWVSVPNRDGMTEIRAIGTATDAGWLSVPLEIQADGALALPAGGSAGDGMTGLTGAGVDTGQGLTAAFGPNGEVTWLVVLTTDGIDSVRDPAAGAERITLPGDLSAGGVTPRIFLRSVGEDAIVGNADTGLAYRVAAGGEVMRIDAQLLDADAVD